MPYLKYSRNYKNFNNYRRKLAIILFFSEFHVFHRETAHQLGSYILCLNKIEKLPKNNLFGKKLEDIQFSQNSIVYELAEVSLVSVS